MNKPILLGMFIVAALFAQAQTPTNTRINPSGKRVPDMPSNVNQSGNAREAIRLNTIDPAVVNLRFWTSKLPSGDKLMIQGIVKNIGGKDFSSGTKQQIQLWEVSTPTSRKMVQQIEFSSLRAGQEISINYERPALKPSDEFPPNYEVLIVYDPDIFSDANPNNDDANMKNNKMSKNPRG